MFDKYGVLSSGFNVFAGKVGLLKGIGSMLGRHGGGDAKVKPVTTLADVVKQAAVGSKLADATEDVMVMDTKLKIIEILQVPEISYYLHLNNNDDDDDD